MFSQKFYLLCGMVYHIIFSTPNQNASLCQELKVYVIFGLLEEQGDKLFNPAAFLGPRGLIGKYRKNH